MARLPQVEQDDLDSEYRHMLQSVSEDNLPADFEHLSADSLHINMAMAHKPTILEAFREFFGTVWADAGLSAFQRELVSLTVIRTFGVEYEWNQHVRVALNEGLTPDEIRAVSTRDYDQFDPADVALMEYVAAYAEGRVDEATHEALAEQFNDASVVGIAMVANIYLMTCRFVAAFEVDLEAPFVGWELENV